MLIDATTAVEDKTFWENAGFDPVGIVAAGLDALRGRAARRLDDHPAARPPAAPRPRTLVRDPSSRRAQDQGDHPVDPRDRRPTRARRQAADHHRLPEPELLRQRVVRRRRPPRRATSASTLDDLTLAQAAILAALPQSPSTYDLVRNAVEECVDPARRTRRRASESQLVVPDDTPDRPAPQPGPRPDAADAAGTPLTERRSITAADFEAAKAEPVVLAAAAVHASWRAPHFVWAVRKELTERAVRPRTPRPARPSSAAG